MAASLHRKVSEERRNMWPTHWSYILCSCGGNLIVNIGATADGRIIPIFEERLRQMGEYKLHTDAAL